MHRGLLALLLIFSIGISPSLAQDAQEIRNDQDVQESQEAQAQDDVQPMHGIAMHGDLKYGPDFPHFDYVNPDAPKGGTLRLSALETFDNFNPHIVRGVSAAGIGLIYAPLTVHSSDEAFSEYAGMAESMEMPEDRSWIIFNIREEATWHDGQPVTAEDVKWSLETLLRDGQPFYRAYYADVESVDVLGEKRVRFNFRDDSENLELPLILGQMPVLPRHYWAERDFTATTLEPPLGNGPYRIGRVDPGRSVTYERVADWWGWDLPAYRGRYNFDRITYEYYRDRNVDLEAFLGNRYDFRQEFTASLWATGYDSPAVRDGRIVKTSIEHELPQGMQAFVYNIRRPVFRDRAVRKALDYAFDYDWANRQFAYDAYTRTNSYFENSEMAAPDHPPQGRVLEILEPFRDQLHEDVFTTRYQPPSTDGSGNNRQNLRQAIAILEEAGYRLGPDRVRVHEETGTRLEFQFLTNAGNAAFDRWIMPFIQNLERIGVKANFRVVDASQYLNRLMEFDYDMTVTTFGQSLSPGNEQREYWKSDRADMPGSRNYIGVQDPVVDALVEKIIRAPSREELVYRTQALDYVLLSGHYVIPNWHIPSWRVAYWDKFEQPDWQAPYALGHIDTWWIRAAD